MLQPQLSINPQDAISQQQQQSDTLNRLETNFILGRVCGKSGAICEGSAITELSLLAVVADGTNYNSAAYSLSCSLASYVAPAWINTGPDQLNILRIADPYGFATFCLQQIFNNKESLPKATDIYCSEYLRAIDVMKLRNELENMIDSPLVIANINKRLTSLISIASSKVVRNTIAKHLTEITTLKSLLSLLEPFLTSLQNIEQVLIKRLTRNGMTPTLLRQQRERNGGSSAMAASYSRDATTSKRKWLKYISQYDRSFAAHIYDTLVTNLTADDLQMPRNDQHFADVTVSPTKLAAIKLQIQKKTNTKVFDDILDEFDLSDIAIDMDEL